MSKRLPIYRNYRRWVTPVTDGSCEAERYLTDAERRRCFGPKRRAT